MKALDEQSLNFKICKNKYEEIFEWKSIKHIRHILCETLFNQFLKNYI